MPSEIEKRLKKLEVGLQLQMVLVQGMDMKWRALVDQFAHLAQQAGIDPNVFRRQLQDRMGASLLEEYPPKPPSPPPSKTPKKPKP